MKAVSPELAAAIEAPDRQLAADRLFVDWDRDGFGTAGSVDDLSGHVTAVSTDGSLQGDYPDDVRIVQGSAARTLSASLGGGSPTDDAVGTTTWFSPVAPAAGDVPLAGKDRRNRPVFHEVGFITSAGPQYVRDFTGISTNLPVSVGQRQATLSAVDNRGLLRKQLTLPTAAASWTTPFGDVIKPGLEATWLASYVFAQNGFYASPPPRAGCRVWAPMHGSIQPFVHDALNGLVAADNEFIAVDDTRVNQPPFIDGPYLAALSSGALNGGAFSWMQALAAPGGTALFDSYGRSVGRIEAWVMVPPGITDTTDFVIGLNVADDEGGLYLYPADPTFPGLEVQLAGSGVASINGSVVNGLLDGNWHFLGLAWDRPAGLWAVQIDTHLFNGSVPPAPPSGTSPGEDWIAQVTCANGAALAEVQATAGGATTDPWLNQIPFTPSAVIDRSATQLSGLVPDGNAVDSGQVLKDLAVALRGTAYFSDSGVGRFRTPAAMVTTAAQTTQVTVTSRDKITDLQIDTDASRVRNIVTCPWVQVNTSFGVITDPAYEATSTVVLPGGITTTLLVDLKGPCFGSTLGIHVAANTAADGTGTDYGTLTQSGTTGTIGPVDITVTQLTASTVRIDLANHRYGTVFLVDATGSSLLQLTGVYLSTDTTVSAAVARDQASIDEYDEQPITLPASPYRQSLAQAVGVAQQTLTDTASPQPVITNLVIVGDPRLEYFDRIAVRDFEGSRLDGTYWVRSIKTSRQGGSYLMTLAATATRDVLLWGIGHWGIEVWG